MSERVCISPCESLKRVTVPIDGRLFLKKSQKAIQGRTTSSFFRLLYRVHFTNSQLRYAIFSGGDPTPSVNMHFRSFTQNTEQNPQRAHSQQQNNQRKKFESPKREAIVDLGKYKDTKVRVKLMGGRLVVGVLKGYDQLMNLVLDEAIEYLKNANDEISKDKTRELGFTVIRGTILVSISPVEGSEVIYVQTSE